MFSNSTVKPLVGISLIVLGVYLEYTNIIPNKGNSYLGVIPAVCGVILLHNYFNNDSNRPIWNINTQSES